MLNILPLVAKKKIINEYRIRLTSIALFMVAMLILASLVLLAPSYILAVTKFNNTKDLLTAQTARQNPNSLGNDIDAKARDINKKVNLFLSQGIAVHSSVPDVISKVIGMKDPTIKILGFSFEVTAQQERLVISGVAGDRDSLAHFVEVLKKSALFSGVDLPVSSYVKSVNIVFSIVATKDFAPAIKAN